MAKRPTISVIVPVYNAMNYIDRCVNSILEQTYTNFEIILVDDGSPDASGIICDRYSAKFHNIRTIHQINRGVSAARNAGIDQAMGDWLCFIDCDDYIESDYLENFHVDNQGEILYVQGFKRINGGQVIEVNPSTDDVLDEKELVCILEENNILNSPCYKLFKSSIIKEHSIFFKEKMSYGEDHLFTLQYMHYVNMMKYNSGCKYTYFLNSGESLSRRLVPPDCLIYYVNVITPVLNNILERFKVDEIKKHTLINSRVHFNLLMAMNNNSKTGNRIDVYRSIKESLTNNMYGFVGLTRNQSLFVWVVKNMNIFILAFLMKINSRLNLTGKLKLGF